MHLISQYDKKYGSELVRSKSKNGTHVFERYITIQCVDNKRRLVLEIAHMPALEDTANFVRKIIKSVIRAGANIETVLLDREFFSAKVMAEIDGMRVGYRVLRKNIDTVVDVLREFVKGRCNGVSESIIIGGNNAMSTPYTMLITERTKKIKTNAGQDEFEPHQRYIGFVTNRPSIDPKMYKSRWGIETEYRMIEDVRAKIHSKNPTVRLLYFVYSIMIFNAWVVANTVLEYIIGIHKEKESLISQQHINNIQRT